MIHRDIKPANVLVALYDDRPVPKVIDFGVAKATGPTLTEHTLNTGFNGVVGTPQYMSPEQATFNNLDIDTRSDVYSLGVLLYELLAGSPPFASAELKKRGLLEILRVVREDEPPRPSTKLSTADALPSLSANRGMEPKKLTGLLRNELDWIVMKALEKDRARRYETANGFAMDVTRYLSGEPVQAHPPTVGYRLKKFVRKHKGPVVAGSVVLLTLLLGIVGTTFGLVRAEQAKQRESERADGERQAKEDAVEQQRRADAERTKAFEFRNKALDALRATTSEDVEKLIGEKTDLTANERAYLEAVAKRWQEFAKQEGTDEQSRAIRAEGHSRVAYLWQKLGRREEARPGYLQALVIWEKLALDFPAVPEYAVHSATSHNNLGALLQEQGNPVAALEQFGKALAIQEHLAAVFPTVPEYRRAQATSHNNLGTQLAVLGKRVEPEKQINKAIVILEQLAADFPAEPGYRRELARSHIGLGYLLMVRLGQRAEVLEPFYKALMIRERLAADFPAEPGYRLDVAQSHEGLGQLLAILGKRAEAEVQYKQALVILEKLAADFPAVPAHRVSLGMSYHSYGKLVRDGGRADESLDWFDKAIATLAPVYHAEPSGVRAKKVLSFSHGARATAHDALAKPAEAVKDWDKAIEFSTPEYQPSLRASRAMSRVKAGQVAEAVAEIAELRKLPGWTAVQLYDFACMYSVAAGKIADKKAEYADAGMELLAKAVKAGYKDAAHMKRDTDLDPLRGREDFRKLLADLEAKFPPTRGVLPPRRG